MAIKKSELYSSLWASCDELRGGMDASQYKDYVLVFLFLKYVSDKYAGKPFAPIVIPEGSGFEAMRNLKGAKDIGDQINKKIIAPLVGANPQLSLSDFPDFNDPNKLGSGRDMVDRLTNLIAIFEDPRLNFSRNRADGDDILGDAYEYLMRYFATESGKSKGQFYTPSEVSRIMARVLGIGEAETTAATTVYDPTCGSGSLLLKVADEARTPVSLFGQEKDSATSGLARMNMILHDNPTAEILQGNTLADPKYLENGTLKTFDYVVANPPFSDKRWSNGVDTDNDLYDRFSAFGVPPAKQGDYAYLLHILRSLKSTGRGACILPHGVLFRGHAEAAIRRKLIRKGYIKAIIGLPPNLFYGTGIPACIVVLDKANARARTGIFIIDASDGFLKEGPKNRLRGMDVHKIVDVFEKQLELPGYSRLVPFSEIAENDDNLNIPRYIDSAKAEDPQNIEAHLRGGIPRSDLDALAPYWRVCPGLRRDLFHPLREGFLQLAPDYADLSTLNRNLQNHPEFLAFREHATAVFENWRDYQAAELRKLNEDIQPKQLIHQISEHLLAHFDNQPLIGKYPVYQHLMDYWSETMQDDCYLIAAEGWTARPERILEEIKSGRKKGQMQDKGWSCDLVPKELIVARYFPGQQAEIDALQAELDARTAELTELEETQGGDDGAFSELDKINKAEVTQRLKELKKEAEKASATREPNVTAVSGNGAFPADDLHVAEPTTPYGRDRSAATDSEEPNERTALESWLRLSNAITRLKKQIKEADAALDQQAHDHYAQLTPDDVKTLVIDDKWMAELERRITSEIDRVAQALTQRVRTLAERYADPLPELTARVADLENRVHAHLQTMGFPS